MPGKIFLHLLILCGIWSQGIIVTFADEEIKESSDFLVRKKCVVSHVPAEDIVVKITDVRHVVVIKQLRRIQCVGNILSEHAVITAALCVDGNPELYQILSCTSRSNRDTSHNVIGIRRYSVGHPGRNKDVIALVVVDPPFLFSMHSSPIQLHSGPLPSGTLDKVSGWGYLFRGGEDRGTNHPAGLRTIQVPIISHQHCVDRYRPHIEISDKDICTFHPQRHCGHIDRGAGLVVGGELVGIFLHSGIVQGQLDPQYPDVFALVQDLEYKNWIRVQLASFNLHHHSSFAQYAI